ncbi:MAG: SIS domain-containing protein [Caldilineaceae bacterium]
MLNLTNSATAYLDAAQAILERIRTTQLENIERAAEICTTSIAGDGLVHLFGTGHSRMFVEEMFPRHGSFPGFHSMVELSLTFHNQVVGSNGQRQAMFLEKVEGLAKAIMRNFVFSAPDSFMIFSNSGVNEVVVEMALEAKARDLPVIALVSLDHCLNSTPRHSSGKRLPDLADVTIDNCVPAGDAMVAIEGLADQVGPGSTVGAATITNMLKCRIAAKLTQLGQPPLVLSSSYFLGSAQAAQRFDDCYDEYRRRMVKAYGG